MGTAVYKSGTRRNVLKLRQGMFRFDIWIIFFFFFHTEGGDTLEQVA